MTKAAKRDALTGETLSSGTLKLRWDIPAHPTQHTYLQEVDLLVAPITLNRSPLHGGAQRVGLAYSSMLLRYLYAGEQSTRDAEVAEDKMWWTSEYGVRRVQRRLLELHQRKLAIEILDAVMDLHREEASPERIAKRYARSVHWVNDKFRYCNRLAAHPRHCPCRYCEKDRRKRSAA